MAASDNINSHQVRNILNDIESRTGVRPLPGALQLPTGDVVESLEHRILPLMGDSSSLITSVSKKSTNTKNPITKLREQRQKPSVISTTVRTPSVFGDSDSVEFSDMFADDFSINLQGEGAQQKVKGLNLKPGYPGIKHPNPGKPLKRKSYNRSRKEPSTQHLLVGYEGRPFNLYTQEFDDHIAN